MADSEETFIQAMRRFDDLFAQAQARHRRNMRVMLWLAAVLLLGLVVLPRVLP